MKIKFKAQNDNKNDSTRTHGPHTFSADTIYTHLCMFKEDLNQKCIYTSGLLETFV